MTDKASVKGESGLGSIAVLIGVIFMFLMFMPDMSGSGYITKR